MLDFHLSGLFSCLTILHSFSVCAGTKQILEWQVLWKLNLEGERIEARTSLSKADHYHSPSGPTSFPLWSSNNRKFWLGNRVKLKWKPATSCYSTTIQSWIRLFQKLSADCFNRIIHSWKPDLSFQEQSTVSVFWKRLIHWVNSSAPFMLELARLWVYPEVGFF